MQRMVLYKLQNKPVLESKAFEALQSLCHMQPEKIAIICNNRAIAANLETYLRDVSNTHYTPQIISLNDLIDLSFVNTFSKNKHLLLLYIKSYLYHFQHIPFRNAIYQSQLLMENALQLFISMATKKTHINKKRTLFDSEESYLLSDLFHEFNDYLAINYSIKLKNFYKTPLSHHKLNPISELFFINTTIKYPWEKNCIAKITQSKHSSWLLDTNLEQETTWLIQSFPQIQSITESEQEAAPLTICEFKTHLEEINFVLEKIYTILKTKHPSPITIVTPNNKTYQQSLELLLLQHNIPNHNKETAKPLVNAFISLINFIHKPLTLDTIDTLTSNAWLQKIVTFDIIIDIPFIKVYLDSKNKKQTLDNALALIDASTDKSKINDLSYIDKQINALCLLKKHYDSISNTASSKCWLSFFTNIINIFESFSSLEQKNNSLNKKKDHILDFITQEFTCLNTLSSNEKSKDLYCNWLIQALRFRYIHYDSEIYPVTISSIETTSFTHDRSYFVLGVNQTMYQTLSSNRDYFETITSFHQPIIQNPNTSVINMLLLNLNNSISQPILTSSKEVNESQTIPLDNIITTPMTMSKEITPCDKPINSKIPNTSLNNNIPTIKFNDLSATMIDTYQSCPIKFWFRYILKLEPPTPEQHDISNKDWGITVHTILEEFNNWLKNNPSPTKSLSLSKLTDICNQLLSKKPKSAAWAIKKQKLLGSTQFPGLIKEIIKLYHNNDYLQKPHSTENKQRFKINNVTINSVVDALFDTPTGQVIVDYKTGKTIAKPSDIQHCRSLQMPIYLLSNASSNIEALIYFQIHNLEKTTVIIPACQKIFKETYLEKRKRPFELSQDFLNKVKTHISTLIDLIQENHFSHETLIKNTNNTPSTMCSHCSYNIACRKDPFL
ncbi:hypothetical protein CL657_02530 [bacterium]|nr:hypothetical protein [bacterium]|tara:strand:- start:1436 stop:4126 length:2691 start_codon:yes stop_codon:yes gene_type:complete